MNTVHPIKTCLSRTFLSHVKSESPRQIPSSSVLHTRKLNHIKWFICYLYFVYNACVASSYKWICSVFLHYWNNLRNGYTICVFWHVLIYFFLKHIEKSFWLHFVTLALTFCSLCGTAWYNFHEIDTTTSLDNLGYSLHPWVILKCFSVVR